MVPTEGQVSMAASEASGPSAPKGGPPGVEPARSAEAGAVSTLQGKHPSNSNRPGADCWGATCGAGIFGMGARCQWQRWQSVHCEPSLQPAFRLKYLHALPQACGWPTEPAESLVCGAKGSFCCRALSTHCMSGSGSSEVCRAKEGSRRRPGGGPTKDGSGRPGGGPTSPFDGRSASLKSPCCFFVACVCWSSRSFLCSTATSALKRILKSLPNRTGVQAPSFSASSTHVWATGMKSGVLAPEARASHSSSDFSRRSRVMLKFAIAKVAIAREGRGIF
mmetsp:Transcript_13451/g.29117  ORF Transcript_13451/g.29117 Transcript_13451/m.29117 type:complete len:278 (+) Transcript_13451:21-854(+)